MATVKERVMQVRQIASPANNDLRFLFNNRAVSFGLSPGPTLEDVADKFNRMATMYAETPVTIDVTFPVNCH
jgi:hypothetical protein